MKRAEIEERLRLHILNLCLASVTKIDGAVQFAKDNLIDEVAKMIDYAIDNHN